MMILKWIFAK